MFGWPEVRNRFGVKILLLTTRTCSGLELLSTGALSIIADCSDEAAAAAAADWLAANDEAIEFIAEARMPNWPVRVTTTKRVLLVLALIPG